MVENHPILIQQISTDGSTLYTLWWNSDAAENPKLNFTADDEVLKSLKCITLLPIRLIYQ